MLLGSISRRPSLPTARPATATRASVLSRARFDSRQEQGARHVLLACQGQLRLAPSGYVIGIDMESTLSIAAAHGFDLAMLSELRPAAEAGLIEALSTDRGRGDGF